MFFNNATLHNEHASHPIPCFLYKKCSLNFWSAKKLAECAMTALVNAGIRARDASRRTEGCCNSRSIVRYDTWSGLV